MYIGHHSFVPYVILMMMFYLLYTLTCAYVSSTIYCMMQIVGSGKLEGLHGFVICRKAFAIASVCNSQDNPLKIAYSAHMYKL